MLARVLGMLLTIAAVSAICALSFIWLNNKCSEGASAEQIEARGDRQEKGNNSSGIDALVPGEVMLAIKQGLSNDEPTKGGSVQRHEWGKKHFLCEVKATDVAIALFTLFLVAIGAWQGHALYRTVNAAEDTAERQLRAYVCLDGGSLRLITQPQGSVLFIEGYASLKNFGQTPAHNARSWVRIDVCDVGRPPFDQTSVGFGKSFIGPGSETNLPVHWGPISNQILQAVRDESKRIYIWGGIDYRDIFGKERYFRFYQWNGKEIPARGWPLESGDIPQEGN